MGREKWSNGCFSLFFAILLRSNPLYFGEKLYICGLIMRIWKYISFLLVICFATSCREASTFFGYDTVAKVGRNTLTAPEISAAVPKGLTGADSVSYVDSYIEKWVIRQLKLQEAELIFSSSEADIDRMVEEYRQTLLSSRVDQHYVNAATTGEITDEDIESEYEAMAKQYELELDKVKSMVPNAEIEENLKTRKAVKVIVDNAVAVAPKAE